MAKDQQVAHRGSERLSGRCGRLKCCLRYEEPVYKELAEDISKNNNTNGIAVISGVGVRQYYKNKLDYQLGSQGYMYKYFEKKEETNLLIELLFILFLILILNQFKKYFFLYCNEYY